VQNKNLFSDLVEIGFWQVGGGEHIKNGESTSKKTFLRAFSVSATNHSKYDII
jgi:hypothetical protein